MSAIKIVGIVTVYHYDAKQLRQNAESYLPYIDMLIIWDNTPQKNSNLSEIKSKFSDCSNILFWGTGENEGLAVPFNQAVLWAKNNNYEYLLTMDQDSFFVPNQFPAYKKLVVDNKNKKIGMFSPNREGILDESAKSDKDFAYVQIAISSGAIYPIQIFNSIGLFDEAFFVYMLDIEFCLRIEKNGYLTVCTKDIMLSHSEGYRTKNRFGWTINNYSAQSTYYILRNSILTWKLYPENYTKRSKRFFYRYKVFYRLMKLPFESKPLLKIKAITLGLIHGFKNHGGKYNI